MRRPALPDRSGGPGRPGPRQRSPSKRGRATGVLGQFSLPMPPTNRSALVSVPRRLVYAIRVALSTSPSGRVWPPALLTSRSFTHARPRHRRPGGATGAERPTCLAEIGLTGRLGLAPRPGPTGKCGRASVTLQRLCRPLWFALATRVLFAKIPSCQLDSCAKWAVCPRPPAVLRCPAADRQAALRPYNFLPSGRAVHHLVLLHLHGTQRTGKLSPRSLPSYPFPLPPRAGTTTWDS